MMIMYRWYVRCCWHTGAIQQRIAESATTGTILLLAVQTKASLELTVTPFHCGWPRWTRIEPASDIGVTERRLPAHRQQSLLGRRRLIWEARVLHSHGTLCRVIHRWPSSCGKQGLFYQQVGFVEESQRRAAYKENGLSGMIHMLHKMLCYQVCDQVSCPKQHVTSHMYMAALPISLASLTVHISLHCMLHPLPQNSRWT